ncbi:MAG: hypothetical protein DRO40_09640, partial [Thermoprotei archaeon]
MGVTSISKKEFLKLLEKDEEFRLAVAAKIGLLEILEKLEQHDRKFNEILAVLHEHSKRFEEHDRRFNEILERLDRHEMEIKRIWQKLEEHDRKFNEILAVLHEHSKRFEEHDRRFNEIFKELSELRKVVITVAHRFGVITEKSFREAIRGLLSKYFGASAEKWSTYDEEGIVYGKPSIVDIDVVIRDDIHILVEIKSRADPSDIIELLRIGELYYKKTRIKPRLAIVAGFVSDKAREL